jgi:hypothetical protein
MEAEGAWVGYRKFLFKFSKSFAGRELPFRKAKTFFCGTPIALFCKRLTKLFRQGRE